MGATFLLLLFAKVKYHPSRFLLWSDCEWTVLSLSRRSLSFLFALNTWIHCNSMYSVVDRRQITPLSYHEIVFLPVEYLWKYCSVNILQIKKPLYWQSPHQSYKNFHISLISSKAEPLASRERAREIDWQNTSFLCIFSKTRHHVFSVVPIFALWIFNTNWCTTGPNIVFVSVRAKKVSVHQSRMFTLTNPYFTQLAKLPSVLLDQHRMSYRHFLSVESSVWDIRR